MPEPTLTGPEPPRPDDADRIAELFLADMGDLGLSPKRAAMRNVTRAMLDDARTHIRVLRADERPVAVLVATEFLSIKFPGRALWLEEVYVDPAFRRRGLGKRLVEDFLIWAHAQGIAGVELEAYRMNTAASILYRSLGFRRLARERYAFDMADFAVEGDA